MERTGFGGDGGVDGRVGFSAEGGGGEERAGFGGVGDAVDELPVPRAGVDGEGGIFGEVYCLVSCTDSKVRNY